MDTKGHVEPIALGDQEVDGFAVSSSDRMVAFAGSKKLYNNTLIFSLIEFNSSAYQVHDLGILENEALSTMIFSPDDASVIVATESGRVGARSITQPISEFSCDLQIEQESTAIGAGYIEDSTPPIIRSIVNSPDGMHGLLLADSRYPPLRLFRLQSDPISGGGPACEKIADLPSVPEDAVFVGDGHYALVSSGDGSLLLLDMRLGASVAKQGSGWTNAIEAGPASDWLFFAQGPLLRGLPLTVDGAIETLCRSLSGVQMSAEEAYTWLGEANARRTCDAEVQ